MRFQCPSCDKTIQVDDDQAGKKGRCPGCGAKVTVPEPELDVEFVRPVTPMPKSKPESESIDNPDIFDQYEEFRCKACNRVFSAAALKRKEEKVCMYCGGDLRPRKSTKRGSKSGSHSSGSRAWGAAVKASGYTSHGWRGDMRHEHRVGILKSARMEPEGGLLGPKWLQFHVVFTNRRVLIFEVDRDHSGIGSGIAAAIADRESPADRMAQIEHLYRAADVRGLRRMVGKDDYEFGVGEIEELQEERGHLHMKVHGGGRFEFDIGEYAAQEIASDMEPCLGRAPAASAGGSGEHPHVSARGVSAEFDQALFVTRENLGGLEEAKLFVSPAIPEERLENAINSYAKDVDPDNVLLLFDKSVFHNAKTGFCLTPEALYWRNHNSKPPKQKKLDDIKTISCDPGGMLSAAKILVDADEVQVTECRHRREVAEHVCRVIRALKEMSLVRSVAEEEGSAVQTQCPKCGRMLEPDDRFCPGCGTAVEAA